MAHALLKSGLPLYAGCACGKANCLQQALCLNQRQQTNLSEWVTAYFRSTDADQVGLYLQKDMAAVYRAVEARLWDMLLQMFTFGTNFCNKNIKQEDELTKQLQLVTKEWLIEATQVSDLYARQAIDCLLNGSYTAQEFINKGSGRCMKYSSLASSSAPAPAIKFPGWNERRR